MKLRINRLLLCGLVICALATPAGFADDGGSGDSVPVMPAPAPVSEETTAEPTEKPTATPTPEVTATPTPEVTATPTPEVTATPTPEVTATPTPEVTATPTPEVTATPTPEVTSTPLPQPGSIDGLVNITPEGAARQENGLWKIQLSAPESPISFTWTVSGTANSYLTYMKNEQGEVRFISETTDARIDLPSASYSNGRYMLYVGAVLADGSVTWGGVIFELDSRQQGFPGGFPGGSFPGGFSGGGPGGSGAMGDMPQEEQGLRVTPGEALTTKHSSGTKDTTAYTYSEIIDSEEAVSVLALSSTQTEITLDNGAFFYVSEEEGKLKLVPETDGECWQLNVLAMNTLSQSGIDRVVFQLGTTSYSLPTQMEFSGSIYASLREKGYVSKDMDIHVNARGVRVQIAGGVYSINDNGELIPCEE